MSRRRMFFALVCSVAFLVAGVAMVPGPSAKDVFYGVLALILGVLGTAMSALQLIAPKRLTLDDDGFGVSTPIKRWRRQRSWIECSQFVPGRLGLTVNKTAVLYSTQRQDQPTARRMNRSLTAGFDEAIAAGYGRMSADRLATLLNAYRYRALERHGLGSNWSPGGGPAGQGPVGPWGPAGQGPVGPWGPAGPPGQDRPGF